MNEKKLALITGASSELGRELVVRLARKGTRVLAHYRTSFPDSIGEALSPESRELVIPIKADFSSLEETQEMIDTISRKYGKPQQIIHFPATPLTYRRVSELDWDSFEADMHIQLRSLLALLKAFLPTAKDAASNTHRLKIVLALSSVTVGMPPKYLSSYTILKYAQLGVLRAVAAECADQNVRIYGVSPSMVETRFLDAIPAKVREISALQNPMQRNAAVEDVIPLIEFLLSSDADYMNGCNIPVTGGSVF